MRTINLYIFVHDDVPFSTVKVLGRSYFKDFTEEITKVTGRPFVFNELKKIPGMTDFNYRNEDVEDVLRRWEIAAQSYMQTNNLSWDKTDRYILVTAEGLNDRVMGVAYEKRPAVIATVQHYQVIAHEVGHSFNATHEDAELSSNPWGAVCETYLYPQIGAARAKCYRYTQKNRERIAAYLSDAP